MKIAHLIRRDFLTVDPYSGINAIKDHLIEHSAIVVRDVDDQFFGVLTANDVVQNPRTSIIDCISIKELIDAEDSIEDTILKMNATKLDVFPVGENGNFTGLVFKNELCNYISEYHLELENVIKERTQALEEAISTKDLMFSIIAHDLKSPFNVILSFTGLLKNKLRSMDFEKSEKLISAMNSQARNTYNLLEDLLTWARDNSNKIGYNPVLCNISTICNQVILQIGDTAHMKDIGLNSLHSPHVYAYADKNMIEVILRNLMTNAIKFTENGGEVDIFSMSEGEFVEITVSDNGIGINEELKAKLFKSDFNESKLGTANEKGSGLGLVICRRFIEKHQGKIWIENNAKKGSAFKFTLPIYKEEIHNLQQKEVIKQ